MSSPIKPGWYTDPFRKTGDKGALRYWDGTKWTKRVRSGETVGIKAPAIETRPTAVKKAEPVNSIDDALSPVAQSHWPMLFATLLAVVVIVGLVVLTVMALAT